MILRNSLEIGSAVLPDLSLTPHHLPLTLMTLRFFSQIDNRKSEFENALVHVPFTLRSRLFTIFHAIFMGGGAPFTFATFARFCHRFHSDPPFSPLFPVHTQPSTSFAFIESTRANTPTSPHFVSACLRIPSLPSRTSVEHSISQLHHCIASQGADWL